MSDKNDNKVHHYRNNTFFNDKTGFIKRSYNFDANHDSSSNKALINSTPRIKSDNNRLFTIETITENEESPICKDYNSSSSKNIISKEESQRKSDLVSSEQLQNFSNNNKFNNKAKNNNQIIILINNNNSNNSNNKINESNFKASNNNNTTTNNNPCINSEANNNNNNYNCSSSQHLMEYQSLGSNDYKLKINDKDIVKDKPIIEEENTMKVIPTKSKLSKDNMTNLTPKEKVSLVNKDCKEAIVEEERSALKSSNDSLKECDKQKSLEENEKFIKFKILTYSNNIKSNMLRSYFEDELLESKYKDQIVYTPKTVLLLSLVILLFYSVNIYFSALNYFNLSYIICLGVSTIIHILISVGIHFIKNKKAYIVMKILMFLILMFIGCYNLLLLNSLKNSADKEIYLVKNVYVILALTYISYCILLENSKLIILIIWLIHLAILIVIQTGKFHYLNLVTQYFDISELNKLIMDFGFAATDESDNLKILQNIVFNATYFKNNTMDINVALMNGTTIKLTTTIDIMQIDFYQEIIGCVCCILIYVVNNEYITIKRLWFINKENSNQLYKYYQTMVDSLTHQVVCFFDDQVIFKNKSFKEGLHTLHLTTNFLAEDNKVPPEETVPNEKIIDYEAVKKQKPNVIGIPKLNILATDNNNNNTNKNTNNKNINIMNNSSIINNASNNHFVLNTNENIKYNNNNFTINNNELENALDIEENNNNNIEYNSQIHGENNKNTFLIRKYDSIEFDEINKNIIELENEKIIKNSSNNTNTKNQLLNKGIFKLDNKKNNNVINNINNSNSSYLNSSAQFYSNPNNNSQDQHNAEFNSKSSQNNNNNINNNTKGNHIDEFSRNLHYNNSNFNDNNKESNCCKLFPNNNTIKQPEQANCKISQNDLNLKINKLLQKEKETNDNKTMSSNRRINYFISNNNNIKICDNVDTKLTKEYFSNMILENDKKDTNLWEILSEIKQTFNIKNLNLDDEKQLETIQKGFSQIGLFRIVNKKYELAQKLLESINSKHIFINEDDSEAEFSQEEINRLKSIPPYFFSEASFRSFYVPNQGFIFDVVLNDVTAVKIAEKESIETKLKHSLFSKIAHEFKTPLTSIITIIDDLRNQIELNNIEIMKHSISNIQNLSHYTVFLINDIIQYSSNDNSKIKITKEQVNLKQICKFCFDIQKCLLGSFSAKKRVKSVLEYDNNIDNYEIISDEIRLKQILLNLISNSVKFTKCGSVKIIAKVVDKSESLNRSTTNSKHSQVHRFNSFSLLHNELSRDKDYFKVNVNSKPSNSSLNFILNNDLIAATKQRGKSLFSKAKEESYQENPFISTNKRLEKEKELKSNISKANSKASVDKYIKITVVDTGIGMRPEDLQKLKNKEPLIQINTEKDYNKLGSGLGINIVNTICSLLDIKFDVNSEYGKGTEFSIYLKPSIIGEVKPHQSKSNKNVNHSSKLLLVAKASKSITQSLKNINKNDSARKSLKNMMLSLENDDDDQDEEDYDENNNDNSNNFKGRNEEFFNINNNIHNNIETDLLNTDSLLTSHIIDCGENVNKHCLNTKTNIIEGGLKEEERRSKKECCVSEGEEDNKSNDIINNNNININENSMETKDINAFNSNVPNIQFNLVKSLTNDDTVNLFSLSPHKKDNSLINPQLLANIIANNNNIDNDNDKNNNNFDNINSNNINNHSITNDFKMKHRRNKIDLEAFSNIKVLLCEKEKFDNKKNLNAEKETEEFTKPEITEFANNNDKNNKENKEKNDNKNIFNISNNNKLEEKNLNFNNPQSKILAEDMPKLRLSNTPFNNNCLNCFNFHFPIFAARNSLKTLNEVVHDCSCKQNALNNNNFNNTPILEHNNNMNNTSILESTKNKIIIADDNSTVRKSLINILRSFGEKLSNYELIEVDDGIDIIKEIIADQNNNNQIKAVFTDENMEYINGSEAIKILRELQKHNKIKNCLYFSITAFEDHESKHKILRAGADLVLSKPASRRQVKEVIEKFFANTIE